MNKNGYSRKGFFGETIHYDANGRKIGESRPNFWGGMDHYDTAGNKVGSSQRGFWGEINHYDNEGNKTGESMPDPFRRPRGSQHYKSGYRDEYDEIEAEMMDETYGSEDAAEWLNENVYDPDEFDL